ncbi:unnamed protein product, partial [Mesorhabditis belari]|uniref:Uncharacterized protein n=1 Tax=Mesorhabditis belari TaxID=2138241 RepID=A0AAF3EHC9_9BILA
MASFRSQTGYNWLHRWLLDLACCRKRSQSVILPTHVSGKTLELQKRLFTIILAQIIVVFVTLGAPMLNLLIFIFLKVFQINDSWYQKSPVVAAVNALSPLLGSYHSLLNSMIVIWVTKPYRYHLLNMLGIMKTLPKRPFHTNMTSRIGMKKVTGL